MIDVSVVIVSMNNPIDLIRCVKSIELFNKSIEIEIVVVLFNYSDDNTLLVEKELGNCIFFKSNGIRGFSENNNIGLQHVKGAYTLILNDDTYFDNDSLQELYFKSKEYNIKLSTPVLYHFDNTIQFAGRPKFHVMSMLFHELKIHNKLKLVHKSFGDYFQTYNVSGACFLIETEFFKKLGWFDEDYFFTPEDVAISTRSRIEYGEYPAVFSELRVFHKGSGTSKSILAATMPVAKQGVYLFYRKLYGYPVEFVARLSLIPVFLAKYLFWFVSFKNKTKRTIMIRAFRRCIDTSLSTINTKKLFTKYYNSL